MSNKYFGANDFENKIKIHKPYIKVDCEADIYTRVYTLEQEVSKLKVCELSSLNG
jgi:hypothetical protein